MHMKVVCHKHDLFLKKALEQSLTPIVVVNKIDRDFARPAEVVDEVSICLLNLGADEEQLEFPSCLCFWY